MQESIITAVLSGRFESEPGALPRRIQTLLSNVFVFNTTAYKFYKNDNVYFNTNFSDIATKEARFAFTKADFEWNHALSPDIYHSLKGIRLEGDKVVFEPDLEKADELFICMNVIDMDQGLFAHLMRHDLEAADFYKIGSQLAEAENQLPKVHEDITLYDEVSRRYKDVCAWVAGVETHFPTSESEQYLSYLKSVIESHKSAWQIDTVSLATCMDIHSENAVYEQGRFFPIDTYASKFDWRIGHKHNNIYRIATDVLAFSNEANYKQVLAGYEDQKQIRFDPELESFFVVYASLIMIPHLYFVGEKDPVRLQAAEQYRTFLRNYAAERGLTSPD